jgi:molecular chaperone GrpE (heat shock protein)
LRLQNEISNLEDKLKEHLNKDIKETTSSFNSDFEEQQSRMLKTVNDIEKRDYSDFFMTIVDSVLNGQYIKMKDNREKINYLLRIGVIKLDTNAKMYDDETKYLLTEFGTNVKDKFIENNMFEN